MGAQIALQCAVYGYPVWLWSRSEATLQRAAQSQTEDDVGQPGESLGQRVAEQDEEVEP